MLVAGAELSDEDVVREVELVEERLEMGGDRIPGGIKRLAPGTIKPKPAPGRMRGGERILDADVTLTEEALLSVDVASPESAEPADIEPARCRGTANCSGRTRGVAFAAGLFGGVVAVSLALIRTPMGISLGAEIPLSLSGAKVSLVYDSSVVSSATAMTVALDVRGRTEADRLAGPTRIWA
jgi:hypothetical protein